MSQTPIKTLKEGDVFVGFLLAQEASFKVSAKGTEYLEAKLADASGDIKAFLWDLRAIEGDLDLIQPQAFLKLKGSITSFNGRLQLKLDKLRFAQDGEVGDLAQFFPTSARSAEDMLSELDARISAIGDPWIRRLLQILLQDDLPLREAFAKAPAAKSLHHVRLGGLLEHTLSVATMAERACSHYGELHADLVMAGALLHDLGKTAELTYQRSFGYSDAGNLLGHITLESLWIDRAMAQLDGFPAELRLQLLHIVLSHHGRQEYGSPVVPKTPEALLVHYLDDLDGKLEAVFQGISDQASSAGNWTPYSRSLDRPLYTVRWPKSK
nr:HD domain-containing protein [uncultured Holophaga sp.]